MFSFGRFGTALLLGGFVGLSACSSEVITLYNGFSKPPGCEESFCDVQYDRCYDDARSGSGSSSSCTECSSICGGSSAPSSCYSSCLSACQSSSSLPSVDHCGRALQECRSTRVNTGCADGIDKGSVPRVVPAAKPIFMPPTDAHQDVCSEEEIAYFEANCTRGTACKKKITTRCLDCLLVDQSAERWGPRVRRSDGTLMWNSEGCIASLGDPTCAAKIFAASECHHAACPYPDSTCIDLADATSCKDEAEAAKCGHKHYSDPVFSPCFVGPAIDGVQRDPVPRFFCGK